ncbi:MAG: alpha/beta fold hydrolase [Betaproteobacteria bacterium]|nr:alpha/beta fold hydrolase [Betaproteobacteria bacterium]
MQTFTNRDGLSIAWQLDSFAAPWTTPDTVLLLHAAMGSSQRWFRWMPRLAARYRVLRMDLRGHGESQIPSPDQAFSLAHLVGDVLELLERQAPGAVHVVGNSAGGYVAQRLAIEHPERVKTLALYGSTPGLKQSHAPTWIPKIAERGLRRFLAETIEERFDERADPALVEWFIGQAGSNDPAFIARFVTHMCTHDFLDDLVAVRAPTLIVAAGREKIGHASTYPEMQKRIAGSELRTVDTAAHNICDGYADLCLDLLLDFLDRNAALSGDSGQARS